MVSNVIHHLTLTDDLIVEILLRLPVRSLLRFKSVCKSWLSFISNPQFAKSHFDLAAAPTRRLLLKFSEDSKVHSLDVEALFHHDSAQVVFNMPLRPLPSPEYGCRVDIVGSCRGFILLTKEYLNFLDFVIWNPSTGLHKRINNVSMMYARLFGIGYDSSTDDYVVVIATLPPPLTSGRWCTEVHCFSLRTSSWSCTEATVPDHIRLESSHGLLLNGALHWLIQSFDNRGVIIAFDLMERRFSEIPLPHYLAIGLESKIYYLRVMGECLCLCFVGSRTAMPEIWTMKDYKVQSSWTKSFVLSASCFPLLSPFLPICLTKNGETLGTNGRKALVKLNDKGELLEYHAIRPGVAIFGLLHCGMYRESLLSLPDNSEKPSEDEQH